MPALTLIVNGARREVQVAPDVPLLYVLRNDLELSGPQFGCGLSQCGACSVLVDGKEAGSRLNAMLSMGQSKPWPDALEALTGTRQMDATAILDYFAPLSKWLDEQIKGKPIGW